MTKNKRKQGEGMLRLRKDGRWEGRIVVGYDEKGIPKTKNVTAKTKSACEEKLKVLKETLGKAVERLKPDMPYGNWLDFWYQNFCKPSLRETTKVGYENCIYQHIIPAVGQIPLNELTQNDLQQFYAKLKKNGRLHRSESHGTATSNRMVRSCHALCKAALEKAIDERLITRNPSADCKLPPKKGREMQILSPSELGRFLARAKEEGYYEMFLLELSTGMRRGEILGLKWSDLNLTNGALRIARQVVEAGNQIVVQAPKTKKSVRTIILHVYVGSHTLNRFINFSVAISVLVGRLVAEHYAVERRMVFVKGKTLCNIAIQRRKILKPFTLDDFPSRTRSAGAGYCYRLG
ncbi:MAG: tyrosine-type recombinase/integrase family protein [Clostridia bacterium]|nr:tyrosine-type recombinase/integrase family protein [Clostridia bacterium]